MNMSKKDNCCELHITVNNEDKTHGVTCCRCSLGNIFRTLPTAEIGAEGGID